MVSQKQNVFLILYKEVLNETKSQRNVFVSAAFCLPIFKQLS